MGKVGWVVLALLALAFTAPTWSDFWTDFWKNWTTTNNTPYVPYPPY